MRGNRPRERESAPNQEGLRTSSGLLRPRAPHLDGQDKSEGPGLGLEGLTGRQGSAPPKSSEEGEGPHGVGRVSVGLRLTACSLLVFTPRPVRSQVPVP